VVPPSTGTPCSGGNLFDAEPCGAESLGEGFVRLGRPDGQYTAGPKRRFGLFKTFGCIETVVAFVRQPLGAIVDIEQNGVVIPESQHPHRLGER